MPGDANAPVAAYRGYGTPHRHGAYQFIKASAPYQTEGDRYPALAALVDRMKQIPAYAESRWTG